REGGVEGPATRREAHEEDRRRRSGLRDLAPPPRRRARRRRGAVRGALESARASGRRPLLALLDGPGRHRREDAPWAHGPRGGPRARRPNGVEAEAGRWL